MAMLTAIGMVAPADLARLQDRYLDGFAPTRAQERAAWRARMLRYVDAHKTLRQIPGPGSTFRPNEG